MRDSDHTWIHNCYPLVFDLPMTRHDCLKWLKNYDYPEPARSACIGCPFHSNAEWRAMKRDRPEEFQEAVEFERRIEFLRDVPIHGPEDPDDEDRRPVIGRTRIKERAFLHRSLRPLDEVDFSTAEDRGQLNWLDECTGLCGN